MLIAAAAVNLALWIVPSDVVTLIARDRHVLLGRYSREHFTWILVAGLFLIAVVLVASPRDASRRGKRLRRIPAICVVVLLTVGAVDAALRMLEPDHYDKRMLAYRRPVNQVFVVDPRTGRPAVIHDRPDAARTYPVVPPGYPEFTARLTTDERGYRNLTSLSRYDIVTLGDSFTEGSKVSDEHPWPVRLAERTGRTVCNLGMSGYAPQHYAAALKDVGLSLKPRMVVCMLYEENDFREAEMRIHPESEWNKLFKQSPILQRLDAAIVGWLGPINAHAPVRGVEILSWLPMRVPPGDIGKYYTFAPSLLLDLYPSAEQVRAKDSWRAIQHILRDMNETCRNAGADFLLVYAPSKPHVVLPLATDLPADKVRAFAALRAREPLPPPDEFLHRLVERLDVKESMTREFCRESSIPFLSLTPVLRSAAAQGRQVYFTYDDHFSPEGHDVAAAAVAEFLASPGAMDVPVGNDLNAGADRR